ncbi:hypothetical protein ACI09J_001762 [Cronobacter turicensis]
MSKIIPVYEGGKVVKKTSPSRRKLKLRIGLRQGAVTTTWVESSQRSIPVLIDSNGKHYLLCQKATGLHLVPSFPGAKTKKAGKRPAEAEVGVYIRQGHRIESAPRVQKMSFTEASQLSRDLYESRDSRLKEATFDEPE